VARWQCDASAVTTGFASGNGASGGPNAVISLLLSAVDRWPVTIPGRVTAATRCGAWVPELRAPRTVLASTEIPSNGG